MSGHIIGSGRVKFGMECHDGPLADAAIVPLTMQDGVRVITFGGLTKLEALAGQIVGHVKEPSVAVDMAQAVLDECRKRQSTLSESSKS
jgi:hypothetical protein